MKLFFKSPTFLLFLSIFPIFLPIFSGYLLGAIFFLWIISGKRWRESLPNADFAAWKLFSPLHKGLLLFLICCFLSSLGSYYFDDSLVTFAIVIKKFSHIVLKYALLWFALSSGVVAIKRRGFSEYHLSLFLLIVLSIHFGYILVQRYTGLDLVHGFSSILPPNRFAYGVYRVSGFMSHPLTLSYNLALLILAIPFFIAKSAHKNSRNCWAAVFFVASLNLLFTGSRWPLAAVFLSFLLVGFRSLWRYKLWLLASFVLLSGFLWWEGSMISRAMELINPAIPLTERFPRIVFWQVHWKIFLDHPLFGAGFAGMDQVLERYYDAINHQGERYSAHNIFLQTLAYFGLIGFCGLFALLIGLFKATSRAASGLGLSLSPSNPSVLVVGTVIFGLFQNTIYDSEYLYAIWLLTSLTLATSLSSVRACTQSV